MPMYNRVLIACGEERLLRTSRRRSFSTSGSKGGCMERPGWTRRSVKGALERPMLMVASRRVSDMRSGLSPEPVLNVLTKRETRMGSVTGGAMS